MSPELETISLSSARRLALTKQGLGGGRRPKTGPASIVSVVRDLAYVQWDPVAIVAPSHLLSLRARIEGFRPPDLERILWTEKTGFQHWIPMAAVVLTEDYPLYHSLMRRYPDSLSDSWGRQREAARRFLATHRDLRRRVLAELRGASMRLGEFREHPGTKRSGEGWTPTSDVSEMLYHLTMTGDVMVVGHEAGQNVWGLAEEFLPSWAEKGELTGEEASRLAASRALRALGTATPKEIDYHFVRGCYPNLRRTLSELEDEGSVHRVRVEGFPARDERYVHDADRRELETLETKSWEPRVSLLPPFDNLIFSRPRTLQIFGFDYVREQFLPKEKRRYGTYVLPILWGDKLIGRIDPQVDRKKGSLVVHAVHAEPGAPREREVGDGIAEAIAQLGTFVGATRVVFPKQVPSIWRRSLVSGPTR